MTAWGTETKLRRNQRKAVYVHQPKVSDLQVGNDGKGQKGQMQKWLRELTAHGLDSGAEGVKILAHGLKGIQAHQAGEGQGELGEDLPGLHGNESSPEHEQAVDGNRHIFITGAHHADVVAVMADRGGQRAGAKAKALDES